MQIKTSNKSGFTLVEIMIVVAIIGLLAAIAIPNFIKARESSQKSACIANLKQIEGAKATWALENKKVNTDIPLTSDIFGPSAYIRVAPVCTSAFADYVMTAVNVLTVCPNLAAVPSHTL